jgi:hypothetical protein
MGPDDNRRELDGDRIDPVRSVSAPKRRVTRRSALGIGLGAALGLMAPGPHLAAASPSRCGDPPPFPSPFAAPALGPAPAGGGRPSHVSVEGGRYRFSLHLDGGPYVVRGMGYNPRTEGWAETDRRALLERDFQLMAAAGINTVIGWNPAELDGLALDVAAQSGLGLVLPFDFDFGADYRAHEARVVVSRQVLAWIQRYREHPAVRFWGIGNEVLQRVVPPSWCATPPTDEAAERARAFASLLLEVIDQVHVLDPYHPILYRDAEIAYASWVGDALGAMPAARPWLVYGINAFTPRLGQILDDWPGQGIDAPVLVSEYGMLGAERGTRAQPLRDLWSTIRTRPRYVLGGAAYVWYADGPEGVDQQFGLVDPYGLPVDDALDAIRDLYLADASRASSGSSPT